MNEGLNTLSAADVAAVTRNNDGNMWGDGGWFWIIILAFLFCGNGWGNNNGAQDAFISDEFVKRDIFNTNQNESNTAWLAELTGSAGSVLLQHTERDLTE